MSTDTSISIITINYNGYEQTCELMETIPFDMVGLQVVVVDNGSSEDEASRLQQRYPKAHVIASPANLGFAGANNLGIRHASGRYLFFINNDALLSNPSDKEASEVLLRQMQNILEQHKEIGILCPVLHNTTPADTIQWAGFTPLTRITLRNNAITRLDDNDETLRPTPYAHGAAMMTSREVIEKAGMMPEHYFLYYEELDWSLMIRHAGYNIAVANNLRVWHKESQATGTDSPLKTYYLTRNRLIFASRNLHGANRAASLCWQLSVVAIRDWLKYHRQGRKEWLSAQRQAISDFLRDKTGKQTPMA